MRKYRRQLITALQILVIALVLYFWYLFLVWRYNEGFSREISDYIERRARAAHQYFGTPSHPK